MDWQPRGLVGRRRHVLVEDATDAVLGAEERHEREVLLRVQKIDRGRAVRGAAGVIRHQADALSSQPREPFRAKHVDAGLDGRRRGRRRTSRWHEVAAGHRDIRRERDSVAADATIDADSSPQRADVTVPVGCTRFDRKMTQTPVSGSTQIDVPVNPV